MRVKPVYESNHMRFGIRFECPGCGESHIVKTMGDDSWSFNNDYDHPTLSPDVNAYEPTNAPPPLEPRCHFRLERGVISFEADSGHALAGKSVELPELP